MHAKKWESDCAERKGFDANLNYETTCDDCELTFKAYQLDYELNDKGLCFNCHYMTLEQGYLDDIHMTRDEHPELYDYTGQKFVRINGERHCSACHDHVSEDATQCSAGHDVGCTKCWSNSEDKFCGNCGKRLRSDRQNNDDYYNDEYKMTMDYYYEVMGYND